MKKLHLFFIAMLCTWAGIAQHDVRIGLLPTLNLNYSIGDNWKINSKTESRQIFFQRNNPEDLISRYRYERTDIDLVITRKTGLLSSAGGGYMIRFQDEVIIHRFIQQFASVQRFSSLRLAHRLRTDQTFRPEEPMEFRARYRLSLELPLRGTVIDRGELYLKMNNETLLSIQDDIADWENRTVGNVGFFITDRNKLETGFDFRASRLFREVKDFQLWWSLGWYLTLQ